MYLDGEKIYDKKEEDNVFPNLARIRQLKEVIQAKLDSLATAAAD